MSEEVEAVTYSEEEFTGVKTKLDEFRSNNVKLMKDMESLTTKFEGIDVDAYKDMVGKQEQLKNKKLIDAGKIDELLDEKTKSMREIHNKELDKTNQVNQSLQDQLATLVIDNAVRDSALRAGVVETGMDDILLRSKAIFSLKDGKAVPTDNAGNTIFGHGTSEPMSVNEWVNAQMDVAPHLFKSSSGGGSAHGTRPNGTSGEKMTAIQKLEMGFSK
jgi:hypothetical protein|tara:strand:- start:699 stop:1349 length:651 start_codon:yes stop_codon:yes gene_type:complete